MGHQHQVASFIPIVMEGIVVDVTEHSTGFQPIGIVHVNIPAQTIHHLQARLLIFTRFSLDKCLFLKIIQTLVGKDSKNGNKLKLNFTS